MLSLKTFPFQREKIKKRGKFKIERKTILRLCLVVEKVKEHDLSKLGRKIKLMTISLCFFSHLFIY